MAVASHIDKISTDILVEIIIFLGVRDIIRFRNCNRRCRGVRTTEECINLIHKEWSDLFNGLFYGIIPESARNIYLPREPSLYLAFEIQMKDTWKNHKSNSHDIWYDFVIFINQGIYHTEYKGLEQKGLEFIKDQQRRRNDGQTISLIP